MTETISKMVLEEILSCQVKYNEPMNRHTSWRIGGPAEILVEPSGLADIKSAVRYAGGEKISITVVGNGTNLLVSDYGIKGMVIKIGSGLSEISIEDKTITAGAGAKLSRIAAVARSAGMGGLEFISGIPGTLGGAVVMNAGAYGNSISEVLEMVLVIDRNGEISRRKKEDIVFGYRSSSLQKSELIVVETSLKGYPRDKNEIKEEMKNLGENRRASQPLDYPNAGSVFRNPPGYSAGRLIEEAGAKGLREGDAQVSEKHANFIVNLGNATAKDVITLICKIENIVNQKFGIELEKEIKFVGEVF